MFMAGSITTGEKKYFNLIMEEKQMYKDRLLEVLVIWRNMQMKVEINSNSSVKELGMKLVKLCNVNPDTMKLLVPLSIKKRSKVVIPFSDECSNLTLEEAAIPEGKPIRMMGVLENELVEVSQNSKPDLRIIGFEEEEKRLQQRRVAGPQRSLKLPEGDYIFCSFRTLQIPGIQLNPPPSEALRRMHMLACDPGIIAIMNKHRWRVGIMTEMAPEGYVGISPKCLLGFNKNHGEEISLRLRTDDLKGFRKYESIKKTLLHELAHMVHTEHDANFFALNKQLNQEAESLDWTKSKSHTLSGRKTYHYEDEVDAESSYGSIGKKLGGRTSATSSTARASSVAAAYKRHLALTSTSNMVAKMDIESKAKDDVYVSGVHKLSTSVEPDPDDKIMKIEPDPDDTVDGKIDYIEYENCPAELDPDDAIWTVEDDGQVNFPMYTAKNSNLASLQNESLEIHDDVEPSNETTSFLKESDTDVSLICEPRLSCKEPDPDEYVPEKISQFHATAAESGPNDVDSPSLVKLIPEPDLNDHMDSSKNQELQRLEESVDDVCKRLQKAIETLRSEATPVEATSSLQTLLKIIKNVIEHPGNVRFKRLRKGNHSFQRNVANHEAAMEILTVVGFSEDAVPDEYGRSEKYMVFKRNDPALLWLARSALESVA